MSIRLCLFSLFIKCLVLFPVAAQSPQSAVRSFDEIFPNLPPAARTAAFSQDGYFGALSRRASPSSDFRQEILASQSTLDGRISEAVLAMQPVVLVESILVIPGEGGRYSLLDVYNALSQIRNLQGRLYHSHRRDAYIPLFEEATRVDARRRNVSLADPGIATSIPQSETIYVRLRDANFGNTFYRAQMTLDGRGLRYTLVNNRTISWTVIPAIREGNFIAQMYFEPIAEGILIYSLAGVDVSNIVYSQIHMRSAISTRLAVIIEWVADGIIGR